MTVPRLAAGASGKFWIEAAMRAFRYDGQVLLCTLVFVAANYLYPIVPLNPILLLLFSLFFGWSLLLAGHVARMVLKRRIQDFMLFGVGVICACVAYFAVLYHGLLVLQGYEGLVYGANGESLLTMPHLTAHYTLYYSFITFFAVGYGDFHPTTPVFMFLSTAEAFCGYVMTVLLITAGLDRLRGTRREHEGD